MRHPTNSIELAGAKVHHLKAYKNNAHPHRLFRLTIPSKESLLFASETDSDATAWVITIDNAARLAEQGQIASLEERIKTLRYTMSEKAEAYYRQSQFESSKSLMGLDKSTQQSIYCLSSQAEELEDKLRNCRAMMSVVNDPAYLATPCNASTRQHSRVASYESASSGYSGTSEDVSGSSVPIYHQQQQQTFSDTASVISGHTTYSYNSSIVGGGGGGIGGSVASIYRGLPPRPHHLTSGPKIDRVISVGSGLYPHRQLSGHQFVPQMAYQPQQHQAQQSQQSSAMRPMTPPHVPVSTPTATAHMQQVSAQIQSQQQQQQHQSQYYMPGNPNATLKPRVPRGPSIASLASIANSVVVPSPSTIPIEPPSHVIFSQKRLHSEPSSMNLFTPPPVPPPLPSLSAGPQSQAWQHPNLAAATNMNTTIPSTDETRYTSSPSSSSLATSTSMTALNSRRVFSYNSISTVNANDYNAATQSHASSVQSSLQNLHQSKSNLSQEHMMLHQQEQNDKQLMMSSSEDWKKNNKPPPAPPNIQITEPSSMRLSVGTLSETPLGSANDLAGNANIKLERSGFKVVGIDTDQQQPSWDDDSGSSSASSLAQELKLTMQKMREKRQQQHQLAKQPVKSV
jgi:hypothetical protein